jgi:hypothetical protein
MATMTRDVRWWLQKDRKYGEIVYVLISERGKPELSVTASSVSPLTVDLCGN